MKIGVFLARMQPMHNAHIWMIREALKDNEKVLVILGSSNKKRTLRNPLTFKYRINLLMTHIAQNFTPEEFEKIDVMELPDWGKENGTDEIWKWGEYLYYNIVSRIEQKTFSIYYSDSPTFIKNWFNHRQDLRNNINIRLVERSGLFNGLSATKVRKAIRTGDLDYIEKYCPQEILENYDYIKKQYEDVLKNPNEDFAMK